MLPITPIQLGEIEAHAVLLAEKYSLLTRQKLILLEGSKLTKVECILLDQ